MQPVRNWQSGVQFPREAPSD